MPIGRRRKLVLPRGSLFILIFIPLLLAFTLLALRIMPTAPSALRGASTAPLPCAEGRGARPYQTPASWPGPFIGANQVHFMDFPLFAGKKTWGLVREAFRSAHGNGISVMRIFLDEPVDCKSPSCREYAHSFNHDFSKRMAFYDRVIAIAAANHVRLIAVLADFAGYSPKYASWYFAHHPYARITSPKAVLEYKSYIKRVLARRNSVTGIRYRDDPAIFAWDVANEPQLARLHQTCSQFSTWVADIAGYVKRMDSKHLATVGGVVSYGGDLLAPDCLRVEQASALDFISIHYYLSTAEESNWPSLSRTIRAFLCLGKPVVVEEFGAAPGALGPRPLPSRYIHEFASSLDEAFRAGASGVLFWGWSSPQTSSWPIFWAGEDHNADDAAFVRLIKNYRFPQPAD